MSLEANKKLACRIWAEVFNDRNLALADELIAPDVVNHEAGPGAPTRGPESSCSSWAPLRSRRPRVQELTHESPPHRLIRGVPHSRRRRTGLACVAAIRFRGPRRHRCRRCGAAARTQTALGQQAVGALAQRSTPA
jgi:hypothetical protein